MSSPLNIEAPDQSPPMATPALPEDVRPKVELIETDGEPLESDWHRLAIALLIEAVKHYYRGSTDFYAGGNMFVYFDEKEARTRRFRGPDFFFVKGASRTPMRRYWVVWQEGGLYPHVIIELLSPKTAQEDRTTKKDIYERVFRTPEYFCYDPDTHQLEGWRLSKKMRYEALIANERGWLWSEELGLWLGTWTGKYQGDEATWLRYYDAEYRLVLTASEADHEAAEVQRQRAEAERQRAEAEHQRAEALAAEVARLYSLIAQKGITPETTDDSPK